MRHALFLVPVALALTVSVAAAESVIGIGTFYGVGIPQGGEWKTTKESKTGMAFGFRFPMALGSAFSLEPYVERIEGKPDQVYNGTLDSYDVMTYGMNLGIGRLVTNHGGLHITPFVGAGFAKPRRENGPQEDKFAWQGGLSIGLHGSETAHWDLRGTYKSVSKMDPPEAKARNYITISLGLTGVVSPR